MLSRAFAAAGVSMLDRTDTMRVAEVKEIVSDLFAALSSRSRRDARWLSFALRASPSMSITLVTLPHWA